MPTSLFPTNEFVTNTEDTERLDSQPINKYYNWTNNIGEQEMVASQVAEAIQATGQEMIYIQRDFLNEDLIFGEDMTNAFTKSYRFVIRVDNVNNWIGEDNTYSKLGLIWDAGLNCVIERTLFGHQVPIDPPYPTEGDLVYWPLAKTLFEITYTSKTKGHYFELGDNPTIVLSLKKYEYSGETIDQTNQGEYQDGIFACSISGHYDQLSCELAGGIWASTSPAVYVCSDPQYTDQINCELNGETWDLVPQEIAGIDSLSGKSNKSLTDENLFTQNEGDDITNDTEDNPFGIKI
jgi:hypothetical protein